MTQIDRRHCHGRIVPLPSINRGRHIVLDTAENWYEREATVLPIMHPTRDLIERCRQ
jgi:hypothetical protein